MMAEPSHELTEPVRQSGADAAASGRRHGDPAHARAYENWTKDELYRKARRLHIEGRSMMTKQQLIEALQGG